MIMRLVLDCLSYHNDVEVHSCCTMYCLQLNNTPLYQHILFIHVSTSGSLADFYFLDINNTAMNICIQVPV